eukprot:COSAG01_NODE_5932_length_3946_cov_1.712763_8_plen_44_part_01
MDEASGTRLLEVDFHRNASPLGDGSTKYVGVLGEGLLDYHGGLV